MMKPNKLMLQIQVADLTDLTLSLHDFVLFLFCSNDNSSIRPPWGFPE